MRWLEVWPPGCRGAAGPGEEGEPREGGGERRWRRRRWFTLEGKVNSSCCFKSLGKPRLQRESWIGLPYRNVSQSRDISEPGELTRSHRCLPPLPPSSPLPPPSRLWPPHSVQGVFRFRVIIYSLSLLQLERADGGLKDRGT